MAVGEGARVGPHLDLHLGGKGGGGVLPPCQHIHPATRPPTHPMHHLPSLPPLHTPPPSF